MGRIARGQLHVDCSRVHLIYLGGEVHTKPAAGTVEPIQYYETDVLRLGGLHNTS